MKNITFRIWVRAILFAFIVIACCVLVEAGDEGVFLILLSALLAIVFGLPLLIACYIFLCLAKPFMKTKGITIFFFLLCSTLAAATGIMADMMLSGIGPYSSGFELSLYGTVAGGAALLAATSVLTYYRTISQFII